MFRYILTSRLYIVFCFNILIYVACQCQYSFHWLWNPHKKVKKKKTEHTQSKRKTPTTYNKNNTQETLKKKKKKKLTHERCFFLWHASLRVFLGLIKVILDLLCIVVIEFCRGIKLLMFFYDVQPKQINRNKGVRTFSSSGYSLPVIIFSCCFNKVLWKKCLRAPLGFVIKKSRKPAEAGVNHSGARGSGNR